MGIAALTPGETAVEVARVLATRSGEVAVLGLARSGFASARLLHAAGMKLYVSDIGDSDVIRSNARSLESIGVATQVGGHDPHRIAKAAMVVVSPGIPPGAAAVVAAVRARVPVISEVEVALRLAPAMRVIAVTGTNGKTTTTALIAHLLQSLGHNAPAIGNIGMPVSEAAIQDPQPDWAALEVSSFQLHDSPGFHPWVGVLTNLTPDHLDRYATTRDYYADKRRMFANAHHASRWVIDADNPDVVAMVDKVAGRVYRFSLNGEAAGADAWYNRDTDMLSVLGHPVLHREQLKLAGEHNIANALAALLAVMVAEPTHNTGESRARLGSALASFRPLAHRLEPVAERNGVLWINDSKATNVSSTLVALKGMTRPTVLLLGGRHKGEPYTQLVPYIRGHCRAVIAYGEACSVIEQDLASELRGGVELIPLHGASFADVLEYASNCARSGDAILLSPACSSYDMFTDYTARGNTFAAFARGEL